MKKTSRTKTKAQSGLSSRFKRDRTYLFAFGYSDSKWNMFLSGYTHVTLVEKINPSEYILVEPTFFGAEMQAGTYIDKDSFSHMKVLQIKVKRIPKRRLIGLRIQTCATIVQYLAGLELGAITAQGLYKVLTESKPEKLSKLGVKGVKQWA